MSHFLQVQDVEVMEGDMTWDWNAGQQMNPHFLAHHLQSRHPMETPNTNPYQPTPARERDRYEDLFAEVGSALLDAQPQLGDRRLHDEGEGYADNHNRWQPAQQSREACPFRQEEAYDLSGDRLQVRN